MTQPPDQDQLQAAARLKSVLGERDMTETQLAKRLGIGPSTINKAAASGQISKKLARAIARELKISAGWLVFGEGDTAAEIKAAEQRGMIAGLRYGSRVLADQAASRLDPGEIAGFSSQMVDSMRAADEEHGKPKTKRRRSG